MPKELLNCVELGPADADYAVIWLHGLGASGHDFEPLVPELTLPAEKKIRFVFPHAPQIPITVNSGVVMNAWYDIAGMNFLEQQDEAGIRGSERHVSNLIAREVTRGVAAGHIFLVGFSQGGAMALHTGLRYPQPLAGIMALSSYLPLDTMVLEERHDANRATPIMMAHGTHDPVIPLRLGEISRDYLQQLGYQVEWHEYFMDHSVHPDEVDDISRWLTQNMQA